MYYCLAVNDVRDVAGCVSHCVGCGLESAFVRPSVHNTLTNMFTLAMEHNAYDQCRKEFTYMHSLYSGQVITF